MPGEHPHGHVLRKGRHSQAGQVYLVTFCCHQRNPVLRAAPLARLVVEELIRSDADGHSHTIAFVVMPDHVHWLFALGHRLPLSSVVRQLKGRAAVRINRSRGMSGRLWQEGFHDHALRVEESLESVGQYVIHNPVRAGLVARAEDYPFCGLGFEGGRGIHCGSRSHRHRG